MYGWIIRLVIWLMFLLVMILADYPELIKLITLGFAAIMILNSILGLTLAGIARKGRGFGR